MRGWTEAGYASLSVVSNFDVLVRLSTLMCVCVWGVGGGGGDCNQGHTFYKLKHRLFKQLLLFLFTHGFKLALQEVSLKLFLKDNVKFAINK